MRSPARGGTNPDEGGKALFSNPPEGTYKFTVIGAGLRDADGDGYENSLDTCPFDVNQGNPRIGGDRDADQDGIDAVCDPDDNETNSDQDLDGYLNRQDNCPQEANGEDQDNRRDTDTDQIGDACDPEPDNHDGQGELTVQQVGVDVAIGPGGPPNQVLGESANRESPSEEDSGGGSGTLIIIIIAAIARVVVVGGGAYYFMRRGGGGGTTA